jgi:hypothetical protein
MSTAECPVSVFSLLYEWERAYWSCPPEGAPGQDEWEKRVDDLVERIATTRASNLSDVRAKLMLVRHWREQGSVSPVEPHLIAGAIADLMHLEGDERKRKCRPGVADRNSGATPLVFKVPPYCPASAGLFFP